MAGDNLIHEFPTTAENILKANEVTVLPVPNTGMGPILTWERPATGYPFNFQLNGPSSGSNGLVYLDEESGVPCWRPEIYDRSISIGDVDNAENDNFEINITDWDLDCVVFAIGIDVGDNEAASEEYIEVEGTGGFTDTSDVVPDCKNTLGFIGIVSTVPLTSVFFNEGNGPDDIFVRDFAFGYLVTD
jgi:hypothetical protein